MLRFALTFCSIIILSSFSFAQVMPTAGVSDEFKRIAIAGNSKLQHGEMFQGFSSTYTQGSQFFNLEWASGYITTTGNQIIRDSSFQYKFDKLRHELFISVKTNDGTEPTQVLLADKSQISSFLILSDMDHVFVPGRTFGTDRPLDFYEVLAKNDSGYTLLKHIASQFVKYDVNDFTRRMRGDVYDEYVDKISYYISIRSSRAQPVSFKVKSFLALIPAEKKPIAEDYFMNNRDKEENDIFMIRLVKALNQ